MAKYDATGVHTPLINMDLIDTLDEMQINPFVILANMAVDAEDEGTRLQAAKELAQYIKPKQKSLDARIGMKASVQYNIMQFSQHDPDAAMALAQAVKDNMKNLPMNKAQMRMLADIDSRQKHSAVTIEAMRGDVEKLRVGDDGIEEL
jgi:hypothetical protein